MIARALPARVEGRIVIAVVVIALLIAGSVTMLARNDSRRPSGALPPTPPSPSVTIGRSTGSPPTSDATGSAPFRCSRAARNPVGGRTPLQICVPAIRVDASVMELGLNADRTVQVPPLSRVGDAGWYKYSSAPGTAGPSVILGHVDSAQYGEGVFFRLGQLRSGDSVLVTLGNGSTVTYRISRVTEVSKSSFPTRAVYGATAGKQIRLVTCGGRFDSATGNYLDNIIAFGSAV